MQILLDDDKVWTEGYKRLPSGLLRIPSLYMIGHAKHTKAWDPLITHYHKTLEIVVLVGALALVLYYVIRRRQQKMYCPP